MGNLWISTDGAPSGIGYNDGLFKVTLDGAERGKVEQFLAVPRDAETCGPIIHDDERTVFVAVQHPGEEGTFEAPHSFFPDYVAGRCDAGPRPGARAPSGSDPGVPRLAYRPTSRCPIAYGPSNRGSMGPISDRATRHEPAWGGRLVG